MKIRGSNLRGDIHANPSHNNQNRCILIPRSLHSLHTTYRDKCLKDLDPHINLDPIVPMFSPFGGPGYKAVGQALIDCVTANPFIFLVNSYNIAILFTLIYTFPILFRFYFHLLFFAII
jgi:hypothetical protein